MEYLHRCFLAPPQMKGNLPFFGSLAELLLLSIYLYLSIDTASTPSRGLSGRWAEASRQEKEKSKIHVVKIKKLKGMIQKRLKTVKNKPCGLYVLGHAMWNCPYRWPKWLKVREERDMMGKSIPLNNSQREGWIFIVTGCSLYLDKVKRVHVPCHSDGVINILREGNSNQVVHYLIEEDQSSICSSVLKRSLP